MTDYGSTAGEYYQKGWRGVLPLPKGQKKPPPSDTTGYNGYYPSWPDIQAWIDEDPDRNLGLRLPNSVVGIDVDNYRDKRGGTTLIEAERRWGPLPATWRSTSRDDGLSGIRLFRIPPGLELETMLTFPELGLGDVEIIQFFHRYCVSWPSMHPEGRQYRWLGPDRMAADIPRVAALPELPESWIKGLARKKAETVSVSVDVSGAIQGLTDGVMALPVQTLLSKAITDLMGDAATRHDVTLQHVLRLIRESEKGHSGVKTALKMLEAQFVKAVAKDRGGEQAARDEFWRMVTNERGHGLIAQTPSVQTLIGGPIPSSAEPRTEEEEESNDSVWELMGGEPKQEEGAGQTNRTSWGAIDIGEILDSDWEPEQPTELFRDDGQALLYPGRVNALVGEPESAKSWIAQLGCVQAITGNRGILYIDFEDTPLNMISRFRLLGADDGSIRLKVGYIWPDTPLGPDEQEELFEVLDTHRPAMIVVDGVNAAMTLMGLELNDNKESTQFHQYLLKPLTRNNAVVVTIDHLPKNRLGRGSFAIGAQAKKAMIDGAMLGVEVKQPFGRGRSGRAEITVMKDKIGAVRALAERRGNSDYLATVDINAENEGRVDMRIYFEERNREESGTNKKDVTLMSRMGAISRHLQSMGEEGDGKTNIRASVGGNKEVTNKALDQLLLKGKVRMGGTEARPKYVHVSLYAPDEVDLLGLDDEDD